MLSFAQSRSTSINGEVVFQSGAGLASRAAAYCCGSFDVSLRYVELHHGNVPKEVQFLIGAAENQAIKPLDRPQSGRNIHLD